MTLWDAIWTVLLVLGLVWGTVFVCTLAWLAIQEARYRRDTR